MLLLLLLLLCNRALAEAVKAAAVSFKPKPTLKVPDIDDLPEVPKNLHKVRERGVDTQGEGEAAFS
jgi:hypothetical protein